MPLDFHTPHPNVVSPLQYPLRAEPPYYNKKTPHNNKYSPEGQEPMKKIPIIRLRSSRHFSGRLVGTDGQPALVQLDNATFYRQHPSSISKDGIANTPIFPGLTFAIPSSSSDPQYWAVIGPSNAGKTTFLEILRGQHVAIPPRARSYPYLSSPNIEYRLRSPSRALQYVGFNGQDMGLGPAAPRGAYMSGA